MLTKPEIRGLQKVREYHVACIAQYRAAAAKLKNETLSLRAMDNAQFHERQLASVDAQLLRAGVTLAATVDAEIANGAAPSLRTNQVIREAIEAERHDCERCMGPGYPGPCICGR